jgi:hypothetical protein
LYSEYFEKAKEKCSLSNNLTGTTPSCLGQQPATPPLQVTGPKGVYKYLVRLQYGQHEDLKNPRIFRVSSLGNNELAAEFH